MNTETATLWKVDPSHSEIQFKVKHLVISTVTGKFNSFSGTVETDGESFENASVSFEADIESITTGDEDRDTHLKSEDFFDAENYPKLKFESDSFKKAGDSNYKMKGNLTIAGNSNQVELDVTHGGTVDDHLGNTKAGFEVSGTINRKEYGLTWSAVTEAGNVVVGDKVTLILNVQLTRQ